MAFTAAHPAAVLPLLAVRRLRVRLDATCLVIGAMAPDFQYFLRGRQAGSFSHTFAGIVGWSLPATLLMALAFHDALKWPALLIAPRRLAARLVPELSAPWPATWSARLVAVAVLSALIGGASHWAWDGVTHVSGWVSLRVPWLQTRTTVPVLGSMMWCRVLQYGTTLLGLAALGLSAWRRTWPPASVLPPAPRGRPRLVAVALIVLGVALVMIPKLVFTRRHMMDISGDVVSSISGALLGALLASLVLRGPAEAWRRAVADAATRPS